MSTIQTIKPSPTLLITGATGFIGFKVLVKALEQGYTVRAAVRSIKKSNTISSHPKILAAGGQDKLSFAEAPDICRVGAYDEALQKISHVIHHASPLPSPFLDPTTKIYEPSIASVDTILQSALKAPTVKKVVITSSSFADCPFPPDPTKQVTRKVAALNSTNRFNKEKQPPFAGVSIFPGLVLGRDDRAASLQDLSSGTNAILLGIITGQSASWPLPSDVAHVSDVAKVHLLALKEDVTRDIGVTTTHQFNDAWKVVKKQFPQAVADGVFTQGDQATVPSSWDNYQEDICPGINYKTYGDIVVDLASQYLELSCREKA